MQGLEDGLYAYSQAARYHDFLGNQAIAARQPRPAGTANHAQTRILDEWDSKSRLGEFGLSVPEGGVGSAEEAPEIADRLGYPVVVKALDSTFLHKSDVGAVALNLRNAGEVASAVVDISRSVAANQGTVERFLVERMVADAVAELIIGIKRDEQFGPVLVIGAGGVLVELISDTVSLLLPTDRASVTAAIDRLAISKLLDGFRGKKAGDKNAIVDAVLAIAAYGESEWNGLMELDVNPLIVLPEGQGVVAVDALISLS